MSFMDRLRSATETAAARAKDELEALQTRRELSQAYGSLGRKVAELVESGKLTEPSLLEDVEQIKRLRAELKAAGGEEQASTDEQPGPTE
jgi:hypothetical protein